MKNLGYSSRRVEIDYFGTTIQLLQIRLKNTWERWLQYNITNIFQFTANSIIHKKLIGVDFTTCFMKGLLNIKIVFDDLIEILDHHVFERY